MQYFFNIYYFITILKQIYNKLAIIFQKDIIFFKLYTRGCLYKVIANLNDEFVIIRIFTSYNIYFIITFIDG